MLVLLDGVPQRVAVVQRLAPDVLTLAGALAQVHRDHVGLHLDAEAYELRQRIAPDVRRRSRISRDDPRDPLVGDEARLDHLGEPRGDLLRGQAREQVEVAEHGRRLVEGADEVLPGGEVDPGLPADRGIDHGQHGRGYGDVAHASQPGGGHEAREIRRRPSAEPDDHIAAGEARGSEPVPAAHERLGGLRPLAVGHVDEERAFPEGRGDRLREPREGRRVNQCRPPTPHELGQLSKAAPGHRHVVRLLGGDVDLLSHRADSSNAATIWLASSVVEDPVGVEPDGRDLLVQVGSARREGSPSSP